MAWIDGGLSDFYNFYDEAGKPRSIKMLLEHIKCLYPAEEQSKFKSVQFLIKNLAKTISEDTNK